MTLCRRIDREHRGRARHLAGAAWPASDDRHGPSAKRPARRRVRAEPRGRRQHRLRRHQRRRLRHRRRAHRRRRRRPGRRAGLPRQAGQHRRLRRCRARPWRPARRPCGSRGSPSRAVPSGRPSRSWTASAACPPEVPAARAFFRWFRINKPAMATHEKDDDDHREYVARCLRSQVVAFSAHSVGVLPGIPVSGFCLLSLLS